ncbi:hypothetical protein PHMEG_00033521 [Phytophthora megakarya]|uniref:Uncharacterized protein n=1 Tax=Phytophthora megakarya TaxID=4795 RepID=A0A225UTS5_9STRA|nr:hypothetical protein PHMEG_00033521 [Phytophthora megakarya]
MSIKVLVPGNSQRAHQTALSAFERFAKAESMTVTQISDCIRVDSSGNALYVVLYKFGVYLAFNETSRRTLLSKNSVASYFGQVKNHFLEAYPELEAASGRPVQKIATVLDKYCAKRGTDFTRQAPVCTKKDLQVLVYTIYKAAATHEDYKGACRLSLLWYLLGRSSDMQCLLKCQLAIYPGGCLYITFKRMKSAASQSASIYYDMKEFMSCPVHALAVATIMHGAPNEYLLDHIPNNIQDNHTTITSSTSPLELLGNGAPDLATVNSASQKYAINVPASL